MNQINDELQCKICGKPIKGGCYNAPNGPFCIDCWENRISEKSKRDYDKRVLKRLQAVGMGLKKKNGMKKNDLNLLRNKIHKDAREHGLQDDELSNEHFLCLAISELMQAADINRGSRYNKRANVD